jgi:hypothetical protein
MRRQQKKKEIKKKRLKKITIKAYENRNRNVCDDFCYSNLAIELGA